jgi:hypothetical protein
MRWPVGVAAVLFAAWVGLLGWWLPGWIKPRLEAEGSAWLGTPVTIQAIMVRPLALQVELTGLRIGSAAAPLFTLGALHVDVAWSSLWRLAPVVSQLDVRQPHLTITRAQDAAGYNFSPVLAHVRERLAQLPPQPDKPTGPPPRFELHAVSLSDGQLLFDDARQGQKHRIEQLSLVLPLVSTQPGDLTRPLQPQLAARIDGSEFKLGGDARPFVPGTPAELVLDWRGFQLAPWADLIHGLAPAAFAPVDLRGIIDAHLALSFSAAPQGVAPAAASAPAGPSPAASVPTLAASATSAAATTATTSATASPPAAPAASTAAASQPPVAGTPLHLVLRGEVGLSGLHVGLPGQGADVALASLRLQGLELAPLAGRFKAQLLLIDELVASLIRQPAPAVKGSGATTARAVATTASSPGRAASASAGTPAQSAASAQGALPASAPSSSSSGDAAAASPPASAIDLELAELACRRCRVVYTEPALQPPSRIELAPLDLTLRDVSADLRRPVGFVLDTALAAASTASGRAAAPGRIQLKGSVAAVGPTGEASVLGRADARLKVAAQVDLKGLDARLAQPYLTPALNLDIGTGRLGAGGDLDVLLARDLTVPRAAGAAALPSVAFRGRVDLVDLDSLVGAAGDELLAWRRLALDPVVLTWRPDATVARLGRIDLDGLQARLILYPDGHLNLADIARRPAAAASAPGAAASGAGTAAPASAAAAAPAPAAASAATTVAWDQIAVRDGKVYFSDRLIKPNFSAHLGKLAGTVGPVSSAAPAPARIELTGAVDDIAPLRIGGQVHPFGARLYTDIEASVRGIPLTRFSSYAERYTGYAVEKGSLSLTLRYHIEQGKLTAENQLFLDQLTFGDEVASPDATKLPVRLAVALLKNRRGEIDLHLPVAGTLDDPQFSIGGVIWRAVLNLIGKALTAPFALLGGGSDDGEMGSVSFAPGSDELDARNRDSLDKLADKLLDRPGIKVEATGHADPIRDGVELERRAAQAAAAAAAQSASASGRAASAPPTKAVSSGAAATSARAAPSSPALAAATGASGPAAAPAPGPALQGAALAAALRALADQRAERVLVHLAARLPIERVSLTRSRVDVEGEAATGVQFSLH